MLKAIESLEGFGEFNASTAVALAELSKLAYEDPDIIEVAAHQYGFDYQLFGFNESYHDTEACLFHRKGVAVLVFRGTEFDYQDILTDLKFRQRAVSNQGVLGKAHRGFVQALNYVQVSVTAALQNLPRETKLYVTGHSLGGALAVLAAVKCAVSRGLETTLYTFGCPKVGNRKFVKAVDQLVTHFDVINATDIVPRVPFYAMGFARSGQRIYLSVDGKLKVGCSFWTAFVDRWAALLFGSNHDGWIGFHPRRVFHDHTIGEYIRKLKGK